MNEQNFNQDYNSNNEDRFNNKYYEKGGKSDNQDSIFNVRVKAGSRRTYFFDVKTNRREDFFIIITERRKRFDDERGGYDKNKIFLYKEDFNKFLKGLSETIDHVKTELMPDFDFSIFDRENKPYDNNQQGGDTYNKAYDEEGDNDTL